MGISLSFSVEHDQVRRESFGEYCYRIYSDGQLIARYWHDYRGDDHGIEFINGEKEDGPVGRMTDFLEGGGPQPLVLSDRAVAYIKRKLGASA
jgi:hypothetical protein